MESFAIHVRATLDFLYDRKQDDRGIVASDYFDDRLAWKMARVKKTPALERTHERVSKEVSHLTDLRHRPDKDWPVTSTVRDIINTFEEFLNLVPSSRIGSHDPTRYKAVAAFVMADASPPSGVKYNSFFCAKTSL